MDTYVPVVGDHVCARRKSKSAVRPRTVVGPVVEAGADQCRIVTNRGTDIEGDFTLPYGEWAFQFICGPDGIA